MSGSHACVYLEAMKVLGFEVIRRAATPVHDVFVLALTAQLTIPVGNAQIIIHHCTAEMTILQNRVEEGLYWKKH